MKKHPSRKFLQRGLGRTPKETKKGYLNHENVKRKKMDESRIAR